VTVQYGQTGSNPIAHNLSYLSRDQSISLYNIGEPITRAFLSLTVLIRILADIQKVKNIGR